MKKKIIAALVLVLLLALGVAAWFYGYYNHKNMDNIPSRELMVSYLKEKGEAYATEKLEGYSVDALSYIWGEPNGQLSGMYGLIWQTEEASILVYFDSDNCVTNVKLDAVSEAENEKEKEERWDLIPMVMVDGVIYVDTGIGLLGEGLSDDSETVLEIDGVITSTVENWEKPTENDQSNFGTGYEYCYGSQEGEIIMHIDKKWFLYATEEVKQELLLQE